MVTGGRSGWGRLLLVVPADESTAAEPHMMKLMLTILAALLTLAVPAIGEPTGPGVREALAAQEQVRVLVVFAPKDPVGPLAPSTLGARGAIGARPGIRVIREYEVIPALAVEIDAEGLESLLADPSVLRVDLDLPGSGDLAQSVPAIGADVVQELYGFTGEGVTVAVIDSGVGSLHPDLLGKVVGEQCFCSGGGGCCIGGVPTLSGPYSAFDLHGHGTHVASTLAGEGLVAAVGVAPGAKIVAVRVLDENNLFCCSSDVIAGLDWVLANRPDVRAVNMSLGTFATFEGVCDDQTASTMAYAAAIDAFAEKGIPVFVASGNTGLGNRMKAPGCIESAIAVGAVDGFGRVASFSGGGSALDLLAPGVAVTAATIGGKTATLSGTSMSTPHATGAAVLLLEAQPRLARAGLLEVLAATGVPVVDPRSLLVFARIDVEAALLALEICDDGVDNDGDGQVDSEDPDCAPVEIDIRPHSRRNFLNLRSRRRLAVAVFGSEEIDVQEIDPASLFLGPDEAQPRHDLDDPSVLERHLRDVDGDGWLDYLSHYRISETGIGRRDTEACLLGRIGSESFRACDDVIPFSHRPRRRHPRSGH